MDLDWSTKSKREGGISLTSLQWNAWVFFCYSGIISIVFSIFSDATSEVERVVFFAHFVEMSQQAAAATFLASLQVPNVSTNKEKRTNCQRHSGFPQHNDENTNPYKSDKFKHGVLRAGSCIKQLNYWSVNKSPLLTYLAVNVLVYQRWYITIWIVMFVGGS